MSESVLILGATSAIARATAGAFAARGDELYLASRDEDELQRIAADLHLRHGVRVHHASFDAEATATHDAFFHSVLAAMPNLSGVVLAFGYLGDPLAARDFSVGAKVIASNFTGAASLLSICANHLEAQKRGFIIDDRWNHGGWVAPMIHCSEAARRQLGFRRFSARSWLGCHPRRSRRILAIRDYF
jgi:short-subunit dehydrogenase